MGVTFYAQLAVGLPLIAIVDKKVTEKIETRYDALTGKPYTIPHDEVSYVLPNGKAVYSIDDAICELENEYGLECQDRPNDGYNNEADLELLLIGETWDADSGRVEILNVQASINRLKRLFKEKFGIEADIETELSCVVC